MYVLVVYFYFGEVFSESVTWSSSCFTNVKLIAISASYPVNDIGGGARKVTCDPNGSLGSRHFLYIMKKRTSLHRERAHLKFQISHRFEINLREKSCLCFRHVGVKLVEIAKR